MTGTLVIKLGGELLDEAHLDESRAIAADVTTLVDQGQNVVMVHGGGPQVTALQTRLGLESRIVSGRRITDLEALQAMKMAVVGQVNVELCSRLLAAGGRPVGLHGASALAIRAHRRAPMVLSGAGSEPIDLGHVGDVDGVNTELLLLLISSRYIPVLACLGADAHGNTYNINADTVANSVAASLGAEMLVMVTNTPGVLKNLKDPASRMPELTRPQADAAIKDGTIAAGMIPKVQESFRAMDAGVSRVLIAGHLQAGELRKAVLEPGSVGTVLTG
jgi:acetylglutamate kinase